jgi:hypothetical protein
MSHLLEVHVTDIHTLLHRSGSALADPGPDLDTMAALRSQAEHAPLRSDFLIRIRCNDPNTVEDSKISTAVQQHFLNEVGAAKNALARLLREGRRTLLLGFTLMLILFGFAELIHTFGFGHLTTMMAESLIIIAWVALWRPTELLLFDQWTLRRQAARLRRLAVAQVEVMHSTP